MAYIIRDGKLEKAHKIQNLTVVQKKQSDKLEEIKKKYKN
jgi:hypothetical protein